MNGDRAEFEMWALTHYDALYRRALVLTGNREAAWDLTQDAVLALTRKWHTLATPHAAYAYALRVMVRLAFAQWRKRNRVRLVSLGPLHDHPGVGPDVDLTVTVLAAMQKLSPVQRAVLLCRYWDDMTQEETAKVLGLKTPTVKSIDQRARAELSRMFGSSWRALEAIGQLSGHGDATSEDGRRDA